jgi:hypothetical protein
MKQGILRFADSSGVIRSIDVRSNDPRGIGVSPVIRSFLDLYPDANDFTTGDGLNTAGFIANLPTPIRGDQGILRLDHDFTDKWRFDGSFNYFRQISNLSNQADLVNLKAGTVVPSYPRSLSAGLTGILTSHLTNEIRFGWVHDQAFTNVIKPFPQVPGVNVALDLAGIPPNAGFLDEPIDVDTQRARTQGTVTDTFQFIDNLTWSKATHTIQAGVNVRQINMFHLRNDKVIGSISEPVI